MFVNMEAWREKLSAVKENFDLQFELKEDQGTVISEILHGKDVFAQLPTGYGKSLIYTLIPLILDEIEVKTHTAVIVSPLKALMKDQVSHLNNQGIKSVALAEDISPSDVRNQDKYSVVFASPEALKLPKWKKIIKDHAEQICVLVFDEAHCISQWGLDFRPDYRSVSVLQSVLSVPTLVLTATATQDIQKDIYDVLGMTEDSTSVIAALPNRPNIYLDIVNCKDQFMEELYWLPEHLQKDYDSIKKIILYVRSINKCHQIFSWILEVIGDKMFHGDKIPENRIVEMFHANTDKESKDRIMENFVNKTNSVKLLISTVAFGMGVNIPDVDLVVHWGLPPSCLSYWQEVGRCARDGRKGHAICYAFKRSITKCSDETLKEAADTDGNKCLRFCILQKFELKGIPASKLQALKIKETDCDHKFCDRHCGCKRCKCCRFCQALCKCKLKVKNCLLCFLDM